MISFRPKEQLTKRLFSDPRTTILPLRVILESLEFPFTLTGIKNLVGLVAAMIEMPFRHHD